MSRVSSSRRKAAVLVDPERTRYDLNFRFLGFPVRVHPFFWLGAVLLGSSFAAAGLHVLLLWVVCMFVSILVHELGHALAFRWFGTGSHITLYIFGGLAVPWSQVRGRWRRALIALAGPVAGFALLGAVWGSDYLTEWATTSRPAGILYVFLCAINLYWGILNLLPVWPLDGGQVTREVCSMATPRRGKRVSLEISLAFAGLVAAFSLMNVLGAGAQLDAVLPWWFPRGQMWTAVMFGLLAFQSWQLLQIRDWDEPDWDDRPPWKR